MNLCKYRHIFGEEGKGVHTHIFGVAMFDLVGTIIIGWILAKLLHVHILYTLIPLFIIAIIMHRLFCVNTTFNKIIFGII